MEETLMEYKRMSGHFLAAMAAVLVLFSIVLPQRAFAWPAKAATCSTASCHGGTEPTATITTAVDGVVQTTASVAAGGSFEIDWRFTNITGSNGHVGTLLAVPTGWTVGVGTGNAPAIAGWNSVWDVVAGAGWNIGPITTSDMYASSPVGYTVSFAGTPWDAGTRDTAFDDASAGDLDGAANNMGLDASITVPGGTTPGTYYIQVLGVGHNAGGTKSHIVQQITVTVTGGADTTPPNVTTTTPTNGATGVALDGQVTINFDENIACATVNTTNITSDSPGWALNTCSAATAVFDTSGQANSTTYNVSVTAAVTDLAGNPLNAAPYNFSYTTVAGGANNPPNVPSALAQYKSDGTTPITQGTYANEATAVLKATVTDPDSDTVEIEVEVVDLGSSFSGVPNCASGGLVASGGTAQSTCSALTDNRYKWQARAKDSVGDTSSWVQY